MSDVKRHRRRWRSPATWFLAFMPWSLVGGVMLLRMRPNAPHDDTRLGLMIGLCTLYTLLIILMWKPWGRKED